MPSKSGRARRSVYLGFAIVLLMLGLRPATPSARQGLSQGPFFVSGRNVNTVGPAPASGSSSDFIGDPLFKQQNEVDCDVSPNDVRLVFCANNDYRGIEAFGDSWIGVTMSDDGGLTWKSRLHPGFPAPGSQIGAADPVVATVPGLGLVGFITIARTDNRGTLSLGRWIERNKENGDRYTFLDKVVIGTGTPGRFADKPAMVAVLTPEGLGGGVTTVGDRTVPNGVIHFGYAIFPGNANNSSSEIYHLMSTDYGKTWSNPKKLSESVGINQGIDFAVGGNTVVATWRRVKDNNESDAIMFARSTDGGKTWSKASVLSLGAFFDQDSSDLQFRTRSMPSIVYDGSAFHVFWAVRGMSASQLDLLKVDARVVVSASADGSQWSGPTAIANHPRRGHQLMPTAAAAGGRVQVNWIDSRNNTREDSFQATLADYDYEDHDAEGIAKRYVYRQAVDVFAAQAPSATSLAFGGAQQVSRYRTALIEVPGTPARQLPAQVEYNFVNARMFKQGGWPFHGDYHTVASQRYLPNPDPVTATTIPWVANTAVSDSHAVFYSAFTDNRDVRGYVWAGPPNTSFTPAGPTLQGESGGEVPAPCTAAPLTDPDAPMVWTPGNSPRSRDQNVYAAATLPGLLVESPSGSKPIGTLQRAYAVTVYNLTPETRTYTLTIASPPTGVFASWERCEPGTTCTAIPQLESQIDHRSSITRTVYVQSAAARPRIVVNVVEVASGQTAQTGFVILNADPSVPQIDQPDGNLADILSNEIYEPGILARQTSVYTSGLSNPEVVPVPSVATPRIEYPRIEYPRIEYDAMGNPRIEYPRIEYPRIEYDAVGNPRIEYPRIEYPRIEYKAIENPRIEYSALSGDVTEITWPVTTDGANTTTAMTAKVFVNGGLPSGTQAQILVTVPYATGVANSCSPEDTASLVDSQVIVDTIVALADDLKATLTPPNVVNPPSWQPSFPVKPGQTVWVTLRIRGVQDASLAGHAGLWVRSQPDPVGDQGANEALDGKVDVVPPVLNLGDLSVLANVEGNAPGGANVSYTVTATDAVDGPVPVDCGDHPPSGSFFPLGSTGVTCSATDSSGHKASESFTVTVVDKTPPTFPTAGDALAPPTKATAPNGAAIDYALPRASDIVDPAPTVACTPASGSTFPVGTTTVTCTATDATRNVSLPSSFTVTVLNNAPTFTPPAKISVPATSAAGAAVTFTAAGGDVEDGPIAAVCTPLSGSTFPLGTTTVNCVVTDSGRATASGSFTVTVADVTAPVVGPHADLTAEATGESGAIVSYQLPTATDNVGVASLTCAPFSGSTFALGRTTVACTAMDAAGNTGSGSFTVTVVDTTPPVIVEAATPTILIWSPNKIMTPVTVSGSITDATTVTATYAIVDEYKTYNTSGQLISVKPDGTYWFTVSLEAWRAGTDSDGRTYTIIVTAVDVAGNTASKSVVVKVPHNS